MRKCFEGFKTGMKGVNKEESLSKSVFNTNVQEREEMETEH